MQSLGLSPPVMHAVALSYYLSTSQVFSSSFSSQGVLGLVAYIGAANAGIPLSYVVKRYGWDGYFLTLAGAAAVALALLAPLANARSFVQDTEMAGLKAVPM
jgi:sugar phosphate permease